MLRFACTAQILPDRRPCVACEGGYDGGLPRPGLAEEPNHGSRDVRHPLAGLIALEYSPFAVDGRPDLSMVIYNPAMPADADRIGSLIRSQPKASR
jgi:hypothetical protein